MVCTHLLLVYKSCACLHAYLMLMLLICATQLASTSVLLQHQATRQGLVDGVQLRARPVHTKRAVSKVGCCARPTCFENAVAVVCSLLYVFVFSTLWSSSSRLRCLRWPLDVTMGPCIAQG